MNTTQGSRRTDSFQVGPFQVGPRLVGLLVAGLLVVLPLGAAAERVAGNSPARLADAGAARAYFGDMELIDQNGDRHRLYSDLLADHVIVISAFFTSCQGVCPVMAGRLRQLQEHVGDDLGSRVRILTFTLDPEIDTVEALADYAQKLGARDGWYFLTGDQEALEAALRKLGQWVDNKEAHSSVLILGNEPTGLWKKVFAMAPATELGDALDSVLRDTGEGVNADAAAR